MQCGEQSEEARAYTAVVRRASEPPEGCSTPRGMSGWDALPEHTLYRDDGCEVSPSCLRCPLPRCKYDEPGGLRALRVRLRDGEIVRLRRRGWDVVALADHFGISPRSVYRALRGTERGRSPGRREMLPSAPARS